MLSVATALDGRGYATISSMGARTSIAVVLLMASGGASADPSPFVWELRWPAHLPCDAFSTVDVGIHDLGRFHRTIAAIKERRLTDSKKRPFNLEWRGATGTGVWTIPGEPARAQFPAPDNPRRSLHEIASPVSTGLLHAEVTLKCRDSGAQIVWHLGNEVVTFPVVEYPFQTPTGWRMWPPSADLSRKEIEPVARELSASIADQLSQLCGSFGCSEDAVKAAELTRRASKSARLRSASTFSDGDPIKSRRGFSAVLDDGSGTNHVNFTCSRELRTTLGPPGPVHEWESRQCVVLYGKLVNVSIFPQFERITLPDKTISVQNDGAITRVSFTDRFEQSGTVTAPLPEASPIPSLSPAVVFSSPSPFPEPTEAQWALLPRALTAMLWEVRGMPLTHQVPVTTLDHDKLVSTYQEGATTAGAGERQFHEALTWMVFGFDPNDVATAVLQPSPRPLTGFYQSHGDRIFVERLPTIGRVWTMIHELEHAAQHQYYGDFRPRFSSIDEWLAYSALEEGDAQFTPVALAAAYSDVPLRRMLREPRSMAKPPKWGTMARVLWDRQELPYWIGEDFVESLFRLGGFPYVDAAFMSPPVSTAQILHPWKYLAGNLPWPIPPPTPPRGFRVVTSSRAGELGVREVLSTCLAEPDAVAAATGWAGDSFTVLSRGSPLEIGLEWSTVWDDEAAARRFEAAAEKLQSCWHERTITAPDAPGVKLDIRGPLTVRRVDRRVAIVRGLPHGDRIAASLVASANMLAPSPSPAPLDRLSTPPTPFSTEKLSPSGTIENGRYTNTDLGLTATLPPGWTGDTRRIGIDLAIEAPTGYAGASRGPALFHFDSVAYTTERAWGFINRLVDRRYRGASLVGVDKAYQLPIGRGIRVRFSKQDPPKPGKTITSATVWNVDFVVIPACNGRATIEIAMPEGDRANFDALDAWLHSFQITNRAPPACELLR
jgi:hypothetical protein